MLSNRNLLWLAFAVIVGIVVINNIQKANTPQYAELYQTENYGDTSALEPNAKTAREKSFVRERTYTQFIGDLERGNIDLIYVNNNQIGYIHTNGTKYISYGPVDQEIIQKANEVGTEVSFSKSNATTSTRPSQEGGGNIFTSILTFLIIGGLIYYVMRRGGIAGTGGAGGAASFGKSKARLVNTDENNVKFADVAGIDEAKSDLEEVVEFLSNPQKFSSIGAKVPKGILLVGPPGTGKTLTARAVAGEAGVPFYSISGSDFVEMFVGVGASRVRSMFEEAKKNAPCLIFIDEIDAVGRSRGAGMGGGNDEREQTLNQLLVEMDGFEENNGIIIIAATNRPDVLDKALLRPGRFDRQVVVSNPDVKGREAILKVHLGKIAFGPDVDAKVIARGTPGFSGAELANLVNEAALLAAKRNKHYVGSKEVDDAKDKVMMGAERRTLSLTEQDRKLTAYHEAGHAICSIMLPTSDPIHKATIVPRGRALGMVMRLPEGDRVSISYDKLRGDLVMAMGGRAAEELKFGEEKITTGASGDIQMATDTATKMITEWGFSKKIGKIRLSTEQQGYLGSQGGTAASPDTAKIIEEEIKQLIDESYEEAKRILIENDDKFEKLTNALLEYETLTGDEINNLLLDDKKDKAVENKAASIPKVAKKAKEAIDNIIDDKKDGEMPA